MFKSNKKEQPEQLQLLQHTNLKEYCENRLLYISRSIGISYYYYYCYYRYDDYD